MDSRVPPQKKAKGADAVAAEGAAAEGFTFAVEPGIKPELYTSRPHYREPTPGLALDQAWAKMAGAGGSVEASSPPPPGARVVAVFTTQNLFAKAVHAAFYGHHPLVLSPDVVWLTIAQGLANHVGQNAEALRSKCVHFEGKREIVIERPEFVKGNPGNDWPGVFPEFAAQIASMAAKGTAELITAEFSTTGPAEQIASQITLMDTVQHYFQYTMCCGCGFPEITLSGTPADWELIRRKAGQLGEYDLGWWLEGLLPALDEFVSAAHGKPDLDFWRSLCSLSGASGISSPLTGWVQAFFPYLNASGRGGGDWDPPGASLKRNPGGEAEATRALKRNPGVTAYLSSFKGKRNLENSSFRGFGGGPEGVGRGTKLDLIPPGMASAPFTYKDQSDGSQYAMAFWAGATCLVQHPSGAIEPKVGWAVLDLGDKTRSDKTAV